MATVTEPELDLTPPPYPVKRFTVEEYHRMIDAGVFADDERFELLEGWIIPKMSRNPPHDVVLTLMQALLFRALPPDWGLRNHTESSGSLTIEGRRPSEPDGAADDLGVVDQPPAPLHQDRLQRLQVVEPLVRHRLADQRPERLGRL